MSEPSPVAAPMSVNIIVPPSKAIPWVLTIPSMVIRFEASTVALAVLAVKKLLNTARSEVLSTTAYKSLPTKVIPHTAKLTVTMFLNVKPLSVRV